MKKMLVIIAACLLASQAYAATFCPVVCDPKHPDKCRPVCSESQE